MRIGLNGKFLLSHKTGVERFAENVFRQLLILDEVNEYTIFTGDHELPPDLLGHPRLQQARSAIPANVFGKTIWEQLALPRLADHHRVDLLLNPANVGPLMFKRNVIMIYDTSFLEDSKWHGLFFRSFYRLMIPRLLRGSLLNITASEFSKTEIVDRLGINPENIKVVPGGVGREFFNIDKNQSEAARERLNLPERYIVFLGSLDPRKNLGGLIRAYDKVVSDGSDHGCDLVVVGKDRWNFKKADLAIEKDRLEDRVHFIGYIEDKDLPVVISGAELMVYPSLYEGFGLPPLEAMACGVPVISSNRASLPEVLDDAAVLVDPCDEIRLADEIDRLLDDKDLKENMKRRGLKRARIFDWKETGRQVLKHIEDVYEQTGKRN